MSIDATHDSARRSSRRWAVALCCWIAFIWGHSLIQGPQSSLESGFVVALMRPLFEAIGVTDVDLMSFLVRKFAHFSEYAILGILAYGHYRARRNVTPTLGQAVAKRFVTIWPDVSVVLVPVVDECLQLFVPGRSGHPRDVLIDLAGLCTGALLAWLVSRLSHRKLA